MSTCIGTRIQSSTYTAAPLVPREHQITIFTSVSYVGICTHVIEITAHQHSEGDMIRVILWYTVMSGKTRTRVERDNKERKMQDHILVASYDQKINRTEDAVTANLKL